MEQYYEVLERIFKAFILLNVKYKYREKGKWKDIEEQVEEDLCREEYAENENFQDVCSVFDEFKMKKYQNDVMQVPAFVYRRLIDFPDVQLFDTDCITTKTFCQGNYRYIYILAQKLFGFDFYFVVKGVKPSVSGTKDFCIDG